MNFYYPDRPITVFTVDPLAAIDNLCLAVAIIATLFTSSPRWGAGWGWRSVLGVFECLATLLTLGFFFPLILHNQQYKEQRRMGV
ncbi:MAG TPA: hypothetical protein VNX47_01260 [Nevskia sp.]|jgi:hypothetical protein|nr:hypothetical protein [Nevskia sp.]